MGTLNWTRGSYCPDEHRNIMATAIADSGAFTTTTSAATVTGLSAKPGDVLALTATTSSWVMFGGSAASVGTGHYIPADVPMHFEVSAADTGAVSIIEV